VGADAVGGGEGLIGKDVNDAGVDAMGLEGEIVAVAKAHGDAADSEAEVLGLGVEPGF
jgi:hypothetical protein